MLYLQKNLQTPLLIMTRYYTLFIYILSSLLAHAYFPGEKEEKTKQHAEMYGALTSSDSYQVDLSYHYMVVPYVGFGASVGVWKVYFADGYAQGKNWEIDDDSCKPENLFIRPSLYLKSPAIKIRKCKWSVFANPGIMISVPYAHVNIIKTLSNLRPGVYYSEQTLGHASTTKGQWCAADIRLGLCLDIGPIGFSAGYLASNHDVYSQYRHMSYKGISFKEFYPEKPFMQGVFLTTSYNF